MLFCAHAHRDCKGSSAIPAFHSSSYVLSSPAMTQDLYSLHRVRLATADQPVFEALAGAITGLSRAQARKAMRAKLLKLGGALCEDPKAVVPPGGATAELDLRQGLRTPWVRARHGEAPIEQVISLGILHLDEQLCIVDKPSGLASVPPPGERKVHHVGEVLRRQLRKQGREAGFLGVVHRLDRDTSGCIAVALTREAQRMLAAQFAGTSAVRTYRCVVAGQPRADEDEIRGKQGRGADGRRALVDEDEAGVEAVTRYKVLRRFARHAELEVELGTGRTHQVRVALAAIGCPVMGDRVYGKERADARAPRLMLHAFSLEVDHPRSGRRIRFESPLPDLFRQVLGECERAEPYQRTMSRPRPHRAH